MFPLPDLLRTPPEAHIKHPVLYKVGGFGLILILFGLLGGKSLQNIGMVLLLIAALGERSAVYHHFKHDPLFKAVAAWCFYIFFRTAWAVFEFPEMARLQIGHGFGMLRVALILPVAFWIGNRLKAVREAYGIALTGVLVTLLERVVSLDFSNPDFGALGIHKSNVGLVLATTLVGGVIFARDIWSKDSRRLWIWRGTWLFVSILLFQWILFLRNRIMWGGLLLWGIYLLFRFIFRNRTTTLNIRQTVGWVSVFLLCAGIFLTQLTTVLASLSPEKVVVKKVLSLDFSDMPVTSFGTRIYLWKIGLDAVYARPFLGWGPGTTPKLMQQGDIPEPIRNDLARQHTHLHDTYLELIARAGLIGFALLGIIMFLIIRAVWNISNEGPPYANIAFFSLSAFFLLGVASLTDNYMRQIGWFFLATLGGVAYALSIPSGSEKRNSHLIQKI